jgi:methylated-DNA-[protein]-cysteine S-methyltransferase
VLAAADAIPSGEVRSYGQIAAAAGRPKGAQATGQALGANPIPVVIPCHRVVASDGSFRGYAGGLGKKEYLLDLERGAATLF